MCMCVQALAHTYKWEREQSDQRYGKEASDNNSKDAKDRKWLSSNDTVYLPCAQTHESQPKQPVGRLQYCAQQK